MIRFRVVLKSELFTVFTSDNARMHDIFDYLKSELIVAGRILSGVSFDQCDYYKLKIPVSLDDDPDTDIIQRCLDETNWQKVSHLHSLRTLAESLSRRHVYVVIQPQEGASEKRAIAVLNRDHKEIFSRLQIKVSGLQRWTMEDVILNMAGGGWYLPNDVHPVELSEIEALLMQRRTYKVPTAQENRDYENARLYAEHFYTVFESTPNQSSNVTDREFVAFFNVLRCFDEDSKYIIADSSSALKTNNFILYFIFPPFYSSWNQYYNLNQEKHWDFPIFIDTHDPPNFWCQFHPKSDLMVSALSLLIPFVICEVSSENEEEGRCRMLLQAIAVARAGQFMMVDDTPKPFFVVAIYLCENLTVERYVVTNTTPTEEEEENRQVSIARKDFDLTTANGAVTFLCEMYNLVGMVEKLAKHLDKCKWGILNKVNEHSSKMISLASMAKQGRMGGST